MAKDGKPRFDLDRFDEAFFDTLDDLPNLLWEVANESSGGGTVDPAFAEALGLAGRLSGATPRPASAG